MSTMTLAQVAWKLGELAREGGCRYDAHDMSVMCSQMADAVNAELAKQAAQPAEQPRGEPVAWMRLQNDPMFSEPTVLLTTRPEDDEPGSLTPLYVKPMGEVLDAPAKVGAVVLGRGVPWESVIACAQRAYAYKDDFKLTPEQGESFRNALTTQPKPEQAVGDGTVCDACEGTKYITRVSGPAKCWKCDGKGVITPRPAVATPVEVKDFDALWAEEIRRNGGINIGADYRIWMKKGYDAALAAHPHTGYSAGPEVTK